MGDDGVRGRPNGEGVGEDDRGLDEAQLLDLGVAHELTKSVPEVDRSRYFLLKQVSAMGKDRRHSGADALPFPDRHLPHENAFDVGDGVERARLQYSRSETDFAGPGSRRSIRLRVGPGPRSAAVARVDSPLATREVLLTDEALMGLLGFNAAQVQQVEGLGRRL